MTDRTGLSDISVSSKEALNRDKAPRETSRHSLRKAFIIVLIVGILNLTSFLAESYYLGGEAMKGKVEAGRYYVMGNRHGISSYTEVSRTAFISNEWHGYSVIITWPFLLLALFNFGQFKRRT